MSTHPKMYGSKIDMEFRILEHKPSGRQELQVVATAHGRPFWTEVSREQIGNIVTAQPLPTVVVHDEVVEDTPISMDELDYIRDESQKVMNEPEPQKLEYYTVNRLLGILDSCVDTYLDAGWTPLGGVSIYLDHFNTPEGPPVARGVQALTRPKQD